MNYQNKKQLNDGKKGEVRFTANINPWQVPIIYATRDEDFLKHWDRSVNGAKVDIKIAKNITRSNKKYSTTQTIIDFQCCDKNNEETYKGWIFGEADYIIFEQETEWIMANRLELIEMMKGKMDIDGDDVAKPREVEPYVMYHREFTDDDGNFIVKKDRFAYAEIEDIKKLGDSHIKPKLSIDELRYNVCRECMNHMEVPDEYKEEIDKRIKCYLNDNKGWHNVLHKIMLEEGDIKIEDDNIKDIFIHKALCDNCTEQINNISFRRKHEIVSESYKKGKDDIIVLLQDIQ